MKLKSFISNHAVLMLSTLASLLFLLFSSINLAGQGLYYDELHQATAAFAYTGQVPFQFASLTFRGIPIMNMNYSGAIKTAIYGLYLLISDNQFSVINWRLVGILAVSAALFLFGILVRKKLPLYALIAFFFLIISDITIIVTTRHDWGPVAFALLFRIIFIGVWLRGELSDEVPLNNSFYLGAFVGISIFEKLSSVVLLFPLLLILLLGSKRRTVGYFLWTAIGGFVGTLPLILANVLSFYKTQSLISLRFQNVDHTYSILSFLSFIKEYLTLGAGENVRNFILSNTEPVYGVLEIIIISLILLIIVIVFAHDRFTNRWFRISGIMLLCYLSIMLGVYFLPQPTWVHHWVIGTPFQYIAIALFIAGIIEKNRLEAQPVYRYSAGLILFAIILIRLSGLVSLQQSFLRGDASGKWDTSLTTIGEFAASKSERALFIAADWGVANQMISFLNGRNGIVAQPDWKNQGLDYIVHLMENTERSEVYLVFHNPPYFIEDPGEIIDEVSQSLAAAWVEQPVEEQVVQLRSVKVVKFVKVKQP